MIKNLTKAKKPEIVCAADMPVGTLGEIIEWSGIEGYVGLIVMRKHDVLVTLDPSDNSCWSNIDSFGPHSNCKIRLLPPKTRFEVSC